MMDVLGSAQLKAIRELPLLTDEEFQDLLTKRDAGDKDAVHTIALHNMRLGYSLVAKTIDQMSYHKTGGIDVEDIWQEVYISLLTAAKDYDPSKGKFSTYAYQFISHRCYSLLHKWERSVKGNALEMDEQGSVIVESPTIVREMDTIDDNTDAEMLHLEFRMALKHLEPVEYRALALLYGMDGDPMKQKDVAKALGISVTSLKGIVQRSFRKLRQIVVTGTNGDRSEYPLLLRYWLERDEDSLAMMINPLIIENSYGDGTMEYMDYI